MRWIGQHIWDLISRFRNDVYFENLQGSAETTALVVDADGKVTTNSLSSGGGNGEASLVRLPVRFKEAVVKGDPVYISGYNSGQDRAEVKRADCDSAAHMPAFGLADADYSNNDNGFLITIGSLHDINTQSYSVGDTLYVASGGGLTNTKPATEAKLIQNVGVVTRSQQNNGEIEVVATGRSNDVPNLDENAIFLGDSNDKSVQTDAPMIGLVTAADSAAARTVLNVDVSGTDNSTDVTLVGANYLSLNLQRITAGNIDLDNHVTGTLQVGNGGTGSASASDARTALGVDAAGTDNSINVTLAGTPDYITISGQEITRNQIDLTTDVTGVLPSNEVKQISMSHHHFFMNSASTTADFFFPYNNLNEASSTSRYYNRTIAPYAGKIVKVIIRPSAAIGTACKLQFHKITDTTLNFGTAAEEVTNVNLNTAETSVSTAFSSATFAAGDVVNVSLIKSASGTANIQAVIVWEYTI